ncbi:putative MAD2L1-binding protein [Scophthalmus maximus]|uniref:Putative MAD2L1-binding protein n=1 Tax=Scophthalmus maximus TaxID=52904 RepID=A0A2U9CCL7_SCOMX|nr:MAD2L1-binding protein isoform X2 [Scophthalmus maximus]AWP14218.1 putative MAD2L1-binding protein [Scophthalmus maximus]
MMQCGKEPAGTFKTMAEVSGIFNKTSDSGDTETTSTSSGDNGTKRRLSFSSDKDISTLQPSVVTCEVSTLHSVADDSNSCRASAEIAEQLSPASVITPLKAESETESKDVSLESRLHSRRQSVNNSEDKENIAVGDAKEEEEEGDTSGQRSLPDSSVNASKQHGNTEDGDAEVRQQLPMTYDQLVYSQKKQQALMQDKDTVSRRPMQSADMDWRKCQQTLQDLEEVLQQLEVLFSLSRVPRVLLLMGGSLVLPKELYEINMEALVLAGGDHCLRVSSCLRQLFRTLFVADLLSDTRPVRLMPTTVLVLAHRDCGVGWFRPKLQFKVPTRVKNQVIALSTDPSTCNDPMEEVLDWQDYVWFQAPMTIKGFSK